MTSQFFSNRKRAFHLGPFPLERLVRTDQAVDLSDVPPAAQLNFVRSETPESLVNAIGDY